MGVQIFDPVVNGNLLAGTHRSLRVDPHPAPVDECFGIGLAGVIDVAGGVAPRSAVYGVVFVNPEEVFPTTSLDHGGRDDWAEVLDDSSPGSNGLERE